MTRYLPCIAASLLLATLWIALWFRAFRWRQ
jgi:hypothetical protein